MADLVCIRTYATRVDAELAKALLEANDIYAAVSADDLGGCLPGTPLGFVGGARLLVAQADIEDALEVLEGTDDNPGPSEWE